MKAFKEFVNLRDEGLPFNIWIVESYYDNINRKYNNQIKHEFDDQWHEFTEIVYVITGIVNQRINGQTYTMKKGDLAFINGLDLHSLYLHQKMDIELLIMQIPPSFISLYYREFWNNRIVSNFFPYIDNDKVCMELQKCIVSILDEFKSKKPAYGYYLASYIYKLLGIIYRNTKFIDSNKEEYMQQKLLLERISPAIEYIYKNFDNDITIAQLSSLTGICKQHFCKCFKKATKYTFTQYLNDIRILFAKELLLTTDKNVTEIAFASGFSSVSYFNRVFKKKCGVCPLEFRLK